MPWIALQDTIWTHHKTMRLCSLLKIQEIEAIGHLVSLWHFTMKHCPETGDLGPWGDIGIESASRWIKKPRTFIRAMRAVKFLDGSKIHAWDEHSLYYAVSLERKERQLEQVRERVRLFRERKISSVTLCNAYVTKCNADTVPYLTLQTNNNRKTPSAVDFERMRMPFGSHKGCYLIDVPVDECEFLLKNTDRLGKALIDGLKWRIALKKNDMTEKQKEIYG